ncbi:hypothetical protein [Streptomyces sp. CAU 1734]|uniref:trypsin-like serine peptidase n=1 Tax=Streptomyces sp. CAU 1734 TaxID=3140360 RepID=UPI003260028B
MRSKRSSPATAVVALAMAAAIGACGVTAPGDPVPAAPASAGTAGDVTGGPAGGGNGGFGADGGRDGDWRNWDKDGWRREAQDFTNPVIEDLWRPERMNAAQPPPQTLAESDAPGDQGVTDPEPRPVAAEEEARPYHRNAAPVGKVFFDGPAGPMVCSATVVKDPRSPGRSNLVWTAGHCVHAGRDGGWYRNIAFVPAYNDHGLTPDSLGSARPHEVTPYGVYWADWVSTSAEWIGLGGPDGGAGAPYDYAVMHVRPKEGTKSLEETVGAALDVDFDAPAARHIPSIGAWGYPAAHPFNGAIMHKCIDRPGRLSLAPGAPTMWRIGCTMTGGSSGGGWFAGGPDGRSVLVSNTSISSDTAGWLAGPRLDEGARRIYTAVSEKYAGG